METKLYTTAEQSPAQIRAEFRRVRHKAERPLYYLLLILNLLAICTLLFSPESTAEAFEGAGGSIASEMKLAEGFGLSFGPVFVLILAAGLLFGCYKQYADILSSAVQVTPRNFPEIYEASVEFARTLGLKKVPEVYITQEDGTINAFAAWVAGRRYVQLNAEILDIAYMENRDFDVVRFALAHEFGHVYMHHITFAYNMSILLGRLLPIIGPAFSRSQEYSADRVAQILTRRPGTDCMAMLAAGRHLYAHVDPEDYVRAITAKRNFVERLARFFVNLFSSHPIAPLRTMAILDPERRSGRLF